jgi:hypothetical protein
MPSGVQSIVRPAVADALNDQQPEQPADDDWRLWTTKETAARLGRRTKWVLAKAKTGELPWVRLVDGGMLFDPDDVREFARAHSVGRP